MSSYPFPAAAPPQATMSSADPTAVFGRRIGAWVIDFLLYMLIMAFVGPTPLSPLAEYVDTNDFPGVDCTVVQDANDVSGCLEIGDRSAFRRSPVVIDGPQPGMITREQGRAMVLTLEFSKLIFEILRFGPL